MEFASFFLRAILVGSLGFAFGYISGSVYRWLAGKFSRNKDKEV